MRPTPSGLQYTHRYSFQLTIQHYWLNTVGWLVFNTMEFAEYFASFYHMRIPNNNRCQFVHGILAATNRYDQQPYYELLLPFILRSTDRFALFEIRFNSLSTKMEFSVT